jgi:hypothetical protein
MFFFGKHSISRPEGVARAFALGQPPAKFSIAFFRVVGRFFCAMSVLGVIFYLAETSVAIFTH